ncbi:MULTISPECIES: hypothetical protein [Sphingobacterium]|uniref:hypothetical protein n=1 Tax=Sphingobacterium TaxID=28453 RepID=UPI0013DBBF43|nr:MULTISPECIES: hypothetical protein [unclassified Sphingobacterium]
MRVILLFLILPFYCFGQERSTGLNVQPTYSDVLYLMDLVDNVGKSKGLKRDGYQKSIIQILEKYRIDINKETINDPFLGEIISAAKTKVEETIVDGTFQKDDNSNNTKAIAQKTQSISPSIGWEAATINGLSNFMAKRFKQETIYYGLNQIFDQISERKKKIFEALLPVSYNEIVQLRNNGSYYSADLIFLKKVIEGDLQKLDERIATNASIIFPKLPTEGLDALKIAGQVHSNLKHNVSFPDIFRKLNSESYNLDEFSDAMAINYLISEALRDTLGSNNTWVDITFLMGNPLSNKKSRYFYGLLKEQLRDFVNGGTLNIQVAKIEKLVSIYSDFRAIDKFLKSYNFQLNKEQSLQLLGLINSSLLNYLKQAKSLNLFSIDSGYLELINTYYDVVYPLQNGEYQKGIVIVLQKFKDYLPEESDNIYRRNIIFALQLAETKDATDMEALLESYALPIGGSSIKRKSKLNVSLNGYVGFTGGKETALGSKNQTKNNIGLAAPMGVSVTFGGNWTAFASIIDLGSIVNVRLQNDTTSFTNLKFEQFFTPGIGLYYNLSKSPFTFGMHYNYVPNLRTIKVDNGQASITETQVSVNRLNLSLLVDIPFFTLFNK